MLRKGATNCVQIIHWGSRRCIRSSADLEAFAPHALAGLIHDRFMNSWNPKVQAWFFHWWLAQELRRIHLNDRDSLEAGWTYLLYDFEDPPPPVDTTGSRASEKVWSGIRTVHDVPWPVRTPLTPTGVVTARAPGRTVAYLDYRYPK